MSSIYDGLASVGKGVAYLKFGSAIVVLIILLLISLYLFYLGYDNVKTNGVIGHTLAKNKYSVTYELDGKPTIGSIEGNYKYGDKVVLNYNTKTKKLTPYQNYYQTGGILLGVTVLGFIGSYIWFYFVTSYKSVSAIEGGLDILDVAGL
jgi:ribosomal protein L21E